MVACGWLGWKVFFLFCVAAYGLGRLVAAFVRLWSAVGVSPPGRSMSLHVVLISALETLRSIILVSFGTFDDLPSRIISAIREQMLQNAVPIASFLFYVPALVSASLVVTS